MRTLYLATILAGLVLVCGCSRQSPIEAETAIQSSGTIARKIAQPIDEMLPDTGRTGWANARHVSESELDKPAGAEPSNTETDVSGRTYLQADGTFADAASIPPHFRKVSADGSVSGSLKRDYKRTDYGFFVQHDWTEELTDPIQPLAIPSAAKELAAFGAKISHLGLREFLGEDIDDKQLTEWINSVGSEIITELAVANMYAHGRDENPVEFMTADLLHAIGKRHGIEIDQRDPQQSIQNFLRSELPKRIRYTDGRPIETDRLESIFYALSSNSIEGKENVCGKAFQRAIAEHFSDDEFFEALGGLFTPLVGVYADRLFPSDESFTFRLKVPGQIIATNGTIVDDDQVEWKFRSRQASIFGFTMHCRSVERIDAVCDKLLTNKAIRHRREMIRLIQLANDDESVRTSMLTATREKTTNGLSEEVGKLLRKE